MVNLDGKVLDFIPMTNREQKLLRRSGKYLAMLLRHRPDEENLTMDKKGFVPVSEILHALDVTKDQLDWIVENNDKKRFAYSKHDLKIRAVQGHSFHVELDLEEAVPPDFLYHGTSNTNSEQIQQHGLLKMERQHVHMSVDIDSAWRVGKRKVHVAGQTVHVLKIASGAAYRDGVKFFRSENGYWLSDDLEVKYLSVEKYY